MGVDQRENRYGLQSEYLNANGKRLSTSSARIISNRPSRLGGDKKSGEAQTQLKCFIPNFTKTLESQKTLGFERYFYSV